jgi:carboxymethylenebutenolidase
MADENQILKTFGICMSILILSMLQSADAQYGGPAIPSDPSVYPRLGEEFQLGPDKSAFFDSKNILIGPLGVTEDSRCPADVLCVWQGRVSVLVNVMQGQQNIGGITLTLGEDENLALQTFDEYYIKLIKVEPYPFSSHEIQTSEYVATLRVSEVEDIEPIDTPLKQFKSGISIEEIKCKEGLQLVMKKTNGNPACLRPVTVATLIERGWAIHMLPEYTKDEPQNSEMFDGDSFDITTTQVNYFEDAQGFLAKPSADGIYPGVILIHEWWGLNDNIKDMARDLASHEYVVLAADLYAGQVATTSDGARQLVTTFDSQKGIENIKTATEFLKQNHGAEKIATIGWCFGGSQSMNFALSGNPIDATIIYYGQPVTNVTQLSKISWPVLGIFGETDQGIPVEKVNEFQSSLNQIGIKNEIVIYPRVGHAFANPSGASYAPEETKDAWQKTILFLENYLK